MNRDTIKGFYKTKMKECDSILKELNTIIRMCGEHLEGNSFYLDGQHGQLEDTFETKRLNLFHYASKSNNIIEIGFNGGHSCLLYLLANTYSKIQLFDLGNHEYARKCFEFLDKKFPNRLSIVWGDSIQTLSDFTSDIDYDMIHIDGGHSSDVLISDHNNCKRLSSPSTIVIIDDISFHPKHMLPDLTSFVVDKLISQELLPAHAPFFSNFHVVATFA